MRHRVAYRKLGRVTEHRISLLRNQAAALLRHERIETTVPKAKELRPFVEHIITTAKRGLREGDETPRALHARRLVLRDIPDKTVVSKLFDTIAPRFEARNGGYTRLLRLGARRGDAADVAQVELVGSEYDPKAKAAAAEAPTEAGAPAKKQTVGERLRSAAKRLRPGKKEQAEEPADAEKEKKEAVPKAKARGAAKKAVKKAAKKAAPKKRR